MSAPGEGAIHNRPVSGATSLFSISHRRNSDSVVIIGEKMQLADMSPCREQLGVTNKGVGIKILPRRRLVYRVDDQAMNSLFFGAGDHRVSHRIDGGRQSHILISMPARR